MNELTKFLLFASAINVYIFLAIAGIVRLDAARLR